MNTQTTTTEGPCSSSNEDTRSGAEISIFIFYFFGEYTDNDNGGSDFVSAYGADSQVSKASKATK